MTKLVLLHKADSIYEDEPDVEYDFPRAYLKAMTEGVGDWVIYYEPAKAGPRGYFAVAKLARVVPKPGVEGRFLGLIEPGSYLEFEHEVPRLIDGRPLESALADPAGLPLKGGAVQRAVRRLKELEFAAIINRGLPANLETVEARRYDPVRPRLDEEPLTFERPVLERLTRRKYRDVAFSRRVRGVWLSLRDVGAEAAQRRRTARSSGGAYQTGRA